MSACAYCGRENEAGAEFCADCGKSLTKAAALKTAAAAAGAPASVPGTRGISPAAAPSPPAPAAACPFCGAPAGAGIAFCPQCGRRLSAPASGPVCSRCYTAVPAGAKFCATCGAAVGQPGGLTRISAGKRADLTFTLVLLDETGNVRQRFERKSTDTTIGREDGDIRFPDDLFLSPLHAKLSWEQDHLVVRDLGSRNGSWVFLEGPHRLADGDRLLIGSQVLLFRRLGYPGPHAPDVDATKRMGSLIPSADIASLTQLRSDGSTRDVIHLSPGRDVHIGRERGDWIFPYDPSMSAQHAMIRSEDADFVVVDTNSRNGVALAARGDIPLQHQSRILVGDKLLRIELPS